MSERFYTVTVHEDWDLEAAIKWLDDPANNVPVEDADDCSNMVNYSNSGDLIIFTFRNRTRALMFKLSVVPK